MQKKQPLAQRIKTKAFWWVQLRDLSILLIVLFVISSYLQRNMVSGSAPPLKGITLSQQGFDISNINKPTLVYFWGTWCGVCKITSPMVNSVATSDDYRVISIAVASGSDTDIQTYMAANDLHFAVINQNQPTQDLSNQWGAHALPSIYIIDDKQQIRFVTSGVTFSWGLKFRLWLTSFY
ncbi:protein disulfide oxidoreductase [Shewanella aestuarii]|uniref:Protein disulfide oxidoreductase n=1 Tax=Shewanella aestuarii TaxID=1028752 RepID=A0A6G9QKE8_9GAMM|nr:protein disulfide oxidoreductase [Shewanella aestuarii]QIR15040.1 protein disulfide oxidoreductase [Shewanella aestuarii]